MNAEKLRIAAYLRVSDEDKDRKEKKKAESDSIGNQRKLLTDFIRRSPEFQNAAIAEYCDDGYSGKNFERPAFGRMMAAAGRGEISCIVVKDLSRFGRDYLTVGNYILRVLPFLGVRLIAVNEGFDSSRQADIESLDTSFRLLLHDLYSRELSRKVKAAQCVRARQGEFLSSFAPFGYRKDAENKKRLVADEAAAEIVRRIFHMAAKGYGGVQIARILNKEEIPTPMEYKRKTGCTRGGWGRSHEDNFWMPDTIIKMLKDERYIGSNVYGRKKLTETGSCHTLPTDRKEWIVVENTHEGLVTREEFARVQERLRDAGRVGRTKRERASFCKRVRCGVCGYAMVRVKTKKPYYLCKTPQVTDRYACPKEKIWEKDLEQAVLADLAVRAACGGEAERIEEEKRRLERQKISELEKNYGKKKKALADTENRLRELYEKFALGEIEKEAYFTQKGVWEKKKELSGAELREIEKRRKEIWESYEEDSRREQWDVGLVAELLREVRVYPGRKMEIVWNYRESTKE